MLYISNIQQLVPFAGITPLQWQEVIYNTEMITVYGEIQVIYTHSKNELSVCMSVY